MTDFVFSKVSGLSYKHEKFAVNDSDGVCARVCFWQSFRPLIEMSVTESVI